MKNVEYYDSFEELFGKKKGKLKEKIKKLADKVKEGVKGAAMLPILAPLAALSPVMKKQIQKRGKKPVKGLKNLTEQFFNVVVRGDKNNFVDPASAMVITDSALAIGDIVKKILEWFKQKNDAKKAGEKLAPEDEELLKDSDKALKNFNPDAFKDDDETAPDTTADSEDKKDNSKMYLILGVAVVAVLLMKK